SLDAYYDKDSHLKCLVPRERIETRAGEISKGQTCKKYFYQNFKKHFEYLEGARGCLTIQVFYDYKTDQLKGIEINPRFGGGYPLSYAAGANYPEWLIKEYLLNQPLDFYEGWKEDLVMLRYDASIIKHA
ncbi:MAG: ATP-grasp domain-containing protein, partial [Lentisphaeraceae bacterium]|nr:ATP-grasp domain-containing protein [Lentisphaeraceae bacterium]